MRSLLEKAIVHLLNGDQDKAEALFHKFMVERAREVHESLRQNEDIQLNEGWDTEIQEEEYFDGLGDEDEEGEEAEGEPVADMGGEPPMGDEGAGDFGAEAGADALDADADALDADADDLEGGAGEQGIEAKLDDIEAKMDELSAEFDRLMGELDVGGDDLGDLGDEDELGDEGLGDEGLGDEAGGEEEFDVPAEGDESADLADRMEDDLGDEDQPEHELPEEAEMDGEGDDEMLEDITESVLAELEKVSMPANSEGKGVAAGGYNASVHDGDSLPHHPAKDRVDQAKPVMTRGPTNDSFERETPPTHKEVKRRRNNDAGVKKLSKVPDKGDKSAELNKDFAARPATQSTIDGKKSK